MKDSFLFPVAGYQDLNVGMPANNRTVINLSPGNWYPVTGNWLKMAKKMSRQAGTVQMHYNIHYHLSSVIAQ